LIPIKQVVTLNAESNPLTEMKRIVACFVVLLTARLMAAPEIVEVKKIWDRAPHNAFTDLIRFHDEWFCVFREGAKHVSADGALRIIASKDGNTWTSAALITNATADLRDAKITLMPDGRLMLSGAGALHPPAPTRHQSIAWFSKDGRAWSDAVNIGEPNFWLWRTTWHKGAAYAVGYRTTDEKLARLYRSDDGKTFQPLVPQLFTNGFPNEATLVFQSDDTALCLLRRDGTTNASGMLGSARPPYTDWAWRDLGVKIGGPNFLRLPDGRLVAAVRLYDGKVRTSLAWLDASAGTLKEFLKLPSGGDCSYAGLSWHEGLLWVSYYSSHEGKTSIYLAKVKVD
jgi:hypothetical protein